MALKKKSKIIISMSILIIIGIGLTLFIKIKNSYIFKIENAFKNTVNATSTGFVFDYQIDDSEINAKGNIEYSFKDLELLGNAESNSGNLAINISRENSSIAYYIDKFNYWVTLDITDIASDILDKISNIGETSIEESFPVQDILELAQIDEKINISKYPNKLTKKFIIKFLNDNFLNNTLKYDEQEKDKITTYTIKPNVYELLLEFIETSKLNKNDKNEIIKELEENKKILEEIDLTLAVSIENGYITEFVYMQSDNEGTTKIILDLENINNAKVEIEEEVLEKLKE